MGPLLACSRTATCVYVSSVFVSLSRSVLARVRASYAWEPVFHQLINIYLFIAQEYVYILTDRDSLHWFLNFLQPSQVPFFSREELALHPVEPCSPTHVLPSVSAFFCLFFSPKRQQHIPFRRAIPIPHHNCIYSDARGC